ncbi:MAG: phosphate ABC transporter substrate-binding protein PstS [Actinomycetales bacterium]|nr:phosphate ABC transporter substrate-binding protein PstS [Actinomycetales bacterium]
MKKSKVAVAAAALATGTLVLTACSSSSSSESTAGNASAPAAASSAAAAPAGDINCQSGSISASGSSAQANAVTEWVNAYQTACPDATIDYQAVGSGAGVEAFTSGQTSFAGTDAAVGAADIAAASAQCENGGQGINIPMVGGAIAVAYNLDGVDGLVLTPDVLAGIFDSTITKWNDAKIADLNPGVTLPDATIAQFHRSDSSGTTANFTGYLDAASNGAWTYGVGKDWTAPGGQGAKGSDQVIASIESTPNSIGYDELSYVQNATNAKAAQIDNGGGPVEATSDNAANTIAGAQIVGSGNNLELSLDYATKTPGDYPIVLVTYEFTCEAGLPADKNPALTQAFLSYAASDAGQSSLTGAGYVPITGDLLTKVRAAVDALPTS